MAASLGEGNHLLGLGTVWELDVLAPGWAFHALASLPEGSRTVWSQEGNVDSGHPHTHTFTHTRTHHLDALSRHPDAAAWGLAGNWGRGAASSPRL